jgi:exodeoxyribonuclease VII small subunit
MAENPKFEEQLEKLEKLVEDLEGGELDLDAALKKFEAGVKLSKELNASLSEATRKVETLIQGPDGEPKREDFDDDAPKSAKKKKGNGQDSLF